MSSSCSSRFDVPRMIQPHPGELSSVRHLFVRMVWIYTLLSLVDVIHQIVLDCYEVAPIIKAA
jgi:hypothetical protein